MNPNMFRALSEFLRHPGLLVPVQRDSSLTFLFISYRPFLDLSMPHLLSPTDGHIEIASGFYISGIRGEPADPEFSGFTDKKCTQQSTGTRRTRDSLRRQSPSPFIQCQLQRFKSPA